MYLCKLCLAITDTNGEITICSTCGSQEVIRVEQKYKVLFLGLKEKFDTLNEMLNKLQAKLSDFNTIDFKEMKQVIKKPLMV